MQDQTMEFPDGPKKLRYSFWAGALTLKGSATQRVLKDVLWFGLLAFLTCVFVEFCQSMWNIRLAVPYSPFSAAGAVLGLLLVLRTNAGYDRWWEARKLWGGIVNQSRNLAILGLAHGPRDAAWRAKYISWVAIFPHVIRHSLRNEKDLSDVAKLLGPAEAMRISKSQHMPSAVSRTISDILQEGLRDNMNDFAFMQASQQCTTIIDHVGACERIRNTPLARSSAIQVRRFILFFLASLPFAIIGEFGQNSMLETMLGIPIRNSILFVPVFIMLLAYPLLSLDRIGMELQNPFDTRRLDHLPLDYLSGMIEQNTTSLLLNDPVYMENRDASNVLGISPEVASKLATYKGNETFIS